MKFLAIAGDCTCSLLIHIFTYQEIKLNGTFEFNRFTVCKTSALYFFRVSCSDTSISTNDMVLNLLS